MSRKIKHLILMLLLLNVFSLSLVAQTNSIGKKRLRNSATLKGFVGGEAHDAYVIRARRNQILNVQISWKENDNDNAQFVISRSDDFFSSGVLEGIKETDDGKSQSIKISATGDYYIYVTAHPSAEYTLKVSLK